MVPNGMGFHIHHRTSATLNLTSYGNGLPIFVFSALDEVCLSAFKFEFVSCLSKKKWDRWLYLYTLII